MWQYKLRIHINIYIFSKKFVDHVGKRNTHGGLSTLPFHMSYTEQNVD